MIFQSKAIKTVKSGDGNLRHYVTITSVPAQRNTHAGDMELFRLMGQVTENPLLIYCNGQCPCDVKISHDGERWVLTAYSVEIVEREV
jgi:hypothetical protein